MAAFVGAPAMRFPVTTAAAHSRRASCGHPNVFPSTFVARRVYSHLSPQTLHNHNHNHKSRPSTSVSMALGGAPSPQDRALAALPYLIPLLDSLSFGFFFFKRVPIAGTLLLTPLYPIYQIYRGVPFFAFGIFIVLFAFVVRNTNISRYIRFNAYQALVLDIALIFPQLFSGTGLTSAVPVSIVEILSTSVFYAMTFAIGYSVITIAKGELPDQIPGVSDSVQNQIGPF